MQHIWCGVFVPRLVGEVYLSPADAMSPFHIYQAVKNPTQLTSDQLASGTVFYSRAWFYCALSAFQPLALCVDNRKT